MKNHRKTVTVLLAAAVLLTAVFMTGCAKPPEVKGSTDAESDNSGGSNRSGVYVKLERSDVSSVDLHGGSFSRSCENADGSPLKAGEWIFMGEDIAQLSKEKNSAVLFTVGARDNDDTVLEEAAFLYDAVQENLYITIGADGVTCSTSDAPDAPADVPPVLTLPILD